MTTVPLSQVRQKRALEEALDQAVAASRSQKWKDVGASVAEERAEGVRQAIREGRFADVLRLAQAIAEGIEAHRSKPGAWAAFAREVVRIVPVVSTRPVDAPPFPRPVVSLPPPSPVAVVALPAPPPPAEEPAPQAPPLVAVVALPPATLPEEEPKPKRPRATKTTRKKGDSRRGGNLAPLSPEEQAQLRAWVDTHGRSTLQRLTGIFRGQIALYLQGQPATEKTRAELLAAIAKPPPPEVVRPMGGGRVLPEDLRAQLQAAVDQRGLNPLALAWGLGYRVLQDALEGKTVRHWNTDKIRQCLSEPLPPPVPEGKGKFLFSLSRASEARLVQNCLRAREEGTADGLCDVARTELAAALAAGDNQRAQRCQLALAVLLKGEAGAEARGVSVEEAPAEKPRRPGRPRKEESPAPAPAENAELRAQNTSLAPADHGLRQVVRDVAREAVAAALEVVREKLRQAIDEEIASIRGEIGGAR